MMMKVYKYIGKVELVIAKYALAVLTALVFVSAVARTVHFPIAWAVDGATFLFAWCVFLGADIAMRQDKLVCIDLLVVRLPKKVQYYIKIFNQIVIVVFLAAIVIYGIQLSFTTHLRTFQGIPWISYTWVTITVPLGCILMLATTILKIKDQVKQGSNYVPQYTGDNGDFL